HARVRFPLCRKYLAARGRAMRPCMGTRRPAGFLPEHEMAAVADERRWYREIERRLAARFRSVYLLFGFAALMGFGFANMQRMMHDAELLPATATVVALGTGSSG